jgi:hypothetical protein
MTDEIITERYFRSWERDGRRQLDGKLALAFEDYDEQRTGRLKALDWDDHHATYDPDYEFSTNGRDELGAWTVDADVTTLSALRERGIDVPDLSEIPVALEVHPRRTSSPRTCSECGKDRICSEHDVEGAYPPAERGTAMQAFLESDQGTHICTYCRRVFDLDIVGQSDQRRVAQDLAEAM